jgi:hypothetical protein
LSNTEGEGNVTHIREYTWRELDRWGGVASPCCAIQAAGRRVSICSPFLFVVRLSAARPEGVPWQQFSSMVQQYGSAV